MVEVLQGLVDDCVAPLLYRSNSECASVRVRVRVEARVSRVSGAIKVSLRLGPGCGTDHFLSGVQPSYLI